MKKIILVLFVLTTTILNAQMSDLSNLSTGKMEMFNIITELDGSVYGYFTISKLGKESEDKNKFEYTLLDGSLTKVAGGEFLDANYNKYGNLFFSAEKVNDKLIISKAYYHIKGSVNDFNYTSHRILDLKTNTLSKPFYYENESFITGERSDENLSHELWKNTNTFELITANKNSFILLEVAKKSKQPIKKTEKDIQYITAYNLDKTKKWSSNYNPNNEILRRSIELIDEENFLFTTINKKNTITIHSIDPTNGKELFTYELETRKSKLAHLYKIEIANDKVVIIGDVSKMQAFGFSWGKRAGFFRIVLSKDGTELSKKYFLWDSDVAKNKIGISKKGMIDKKYFFITKRFSNFNDGTTTVLAEKSKEMKVFTNVTKDFDADFIFLNFDKDFNYIDKHIVKKSKSMWSENSFFSQKIKGGDGMLYCYKIDSQGYKKVSKYQQYIGIITIVNGVFNHDKIPVESGYKIFPIKAKEGYILFREINKDKGTDQIRLEKLNY